VKNVANWGNYPVIEADIHTFAHQEELRTLLEKLPEAIPRGLGRCYGDSSLNTTILSTKRLNRILGFNEKTGRLVCESGVTLDDILDVFVRRGWFLPTTPGTKYVTVGGAIASDVHGKNHHNAGSFSNHLKSIDVMKADGSVERCSRRKNTKLFRSTCGGMGLTGIILKAEFNLIPVETAFVRCETIRAENLNAVMDLFEQSDPWTYSVAWIDCLAAGKSRGRSVLTRGEHALCSDLAATAYYREPLTQKGKRILSVPFYFPGFTLNRASVQLFNTMYYARAASRSAKEIIDLDSFFYPLDGINNWNKIYGRRGFMQYQFVLPEESSREGIQKTLDLIARHNIGPFLAVLKLFGKQNGLISFPREGYTLAMDFPVKRQVLELMNELDRIVLDHGGRLYLSKDARMSGDMFIKGYEYAGEFIDNKLKYDPDKKFQSLQSKRIGI